MVDLACHVNVPSCHKQSQQGAAPMRSSRTSLSLKLNQGFGAGDLVAGPDKGSDRSVRVLGRLEK